MIESQVISLASAVLGAIGTMFLFFGSWAYEPVPQGYGAAATIKNDMARLSARNWRRRWIQRIGLGFLLASFVAQGVATLI